MMSVSVVIPAFNEGAYLVDTVERILDVTDHDAFDVVVADDGSTDGSGERVARRFGPHVRVVRGGELGVSGARNLGAQRAEGEVLVFLDGHSYVQPDWLTLLCAPLERPEVGMVGPGLADLRRGDRNAGYGAAWSGAALGMVWLPRHCDDPYPVPLLPGACQALRRADFERVGGYDDGMRRWGSEDLELSLRLWLLGLELLVQPKTLVHHLFRDRQTYRVDPAQVGYNRLRLALLHFGAERSARVIDAHKPVAEFAQMMLWLLYSDTLRRRERFLEVRHHDDDWYFARFGEHV